MQAILTDGTVLDLIMVTGAAKYVQAANRDVLTFVFDASHNMDELDKLFTEVNCESITLIGDDGSENIHNGYVIRTELVKKSIVTEQATTNTVEVTEERIFVSMAQRTYSETQIANIAEELTYTQLALTEVYESMYQYE